MPEHNGSAATYGGCVDLGVTTDKVPGGWLVEVSGEIDLHTAPALRAALGLGRCRGGSRRPRGADVLVDLSGVGFMDSTGLGELVGAHKALGRAGGRLHLVVGSDRVARLLSRSRRSTRCSTSTRPLVGLAIPGRRSDPPVRARHRQPLWGLCPYRGVSHRDRQYVHCGAT